MRALRIVPLLLVLVVGAVGAVAAAPLRTPGVSTGHLLSAGVPRVKLAGRRVSAEPSARSIDDCTFGLNCSAVPLHVDAPDYSTGNRLLNAHVTWDRGSDLDVYLCHTAKVANCRDTLVASAQRVVGASEQLKVRNPAPGDYLVVTTASRGSSDFDVEASFEQTTVPIQVPNDTYSDNGFDWQARAVSAQSDFGEPSIDLDHAGNIYITAPGGAGVQMWRSFDGGNNFDYKEIASDAGGGDSEIEFNLFDIGFVADLEVEDSEVSRSTNHFNTWDQRGVGIEQDRQWFAHECGKTMYLVYHDFVVEAELLNRSDDESGKEWSQEPVFVSPEGQAPGGEEEPGVYSDQQANTFSGPIAVNQKNGDVYVVFAISSAQGNITTGTPPYGDPEQVVVGVSHDKGKTFDLHLVESGGVGELAGLIFPWITVDKAGTVYISWAGRNAETDPINSYLTYSKDRGDTWSKPYIVNQDKTGHSHIYTTMSAGDDGVVDMAWYTGTNPDPSNDDQDWYVDFAQIKSANTQSPQITQSRVFDHSIHHGNICLDGLLCVLGGDRSLLDFFQIQVGEDGMANIAFANNAFPDQQQRVWYAGQTGGPSAGNAMHDVQFCSKAPGGGAGGGGGGGGDGGGSTQLPGPGVRLRISDRNPDRGDTISFRVGLRRCKGNKGTKVKLLRKVKGDYKPVATKTLKRNCSAQFTDVASYKRASYRAKWPKQNGKYRAGKSRPQTVTPQ